MTTLFPLDSCPESQVSIPAIILSSVDFPVPFTPMIPIFSFEFMEKSALSNRTLSVYDFEKFFMVNKFMMLPVSRLSFRQNIKMSYV